MSQVPNDPTGNPFAVPQAAGAGFRSPVAAAKVGWPGVTSLLLSGIGLLVLVGAVVASTLLVLNNADGGGAPDPESPALIAAGLGIFLGIGLCLLGAVFGLVGLVMSNSNRVTSAIGLTLGLLAVFGVCGLMVIGMAAG